MRYTFESCNKKQLLSEDKFINIAKKAYNICANVYEKNQFKQVIVSAYPLLENPIVQKWKHIFYTKVYN